MERLTIRNSDGSVSQPTHSTFEKVFNRLAEYEDTMMTPEEIGQMKIDLCNAEAILENQIPKKPIIKEIRDFDPMGKLYVWKYYFCGNCGEHIGLRTNKTCSNCGQRIDWSDDDDNK